ncbi:glycogen debranching enzyme GlgX [Orenia metallireducens]|jgi:glycogen operon protein|uniref:Glycogen debranching enzyme GlgX n=1 Tax=Orenia metallireducens TaxID=1413210 RepID=A0A1C0AB48_9FIRM|nr:glycogen debranching protein GlgX [Orenia metallireducens]OCL27597.1 glycogen debranching enzyme GlgX [Orenia metallireducens]
MLRVDTYPTHEHDGIKIRRGKALPFGATIVPGGVNFSVFSKHATSCELVLFRKHEKEPFTIIPFPDEFRIGNVFTMMVFDIDYENIEYGYRMDGPYDPREGFWFDKEKILLDPYAKAIGGREVWGKEPDWDNQFQHRSRIIFDDFDWQGDRPLEIDMKDLVIYETHVRGFTKHSSSDVKYPGTFAAIREKIPYLKKLGINCIELLPVFEFDEFEHSRISKVTGERLMNYWGYSAVGFFAPKAGYAATGKYGMEVDELKNLVKELHKNGIEVILDVVFNHTAEGNEKGPYISYRGIDNKTYYLLTPQGYYYNFSGCGNTLNCNNPIVRNMILDCLRYWAAEYHIDGFRFDLASILSRDQKGAPMVNPPLLEALAHDPVLGKCKLIAEAWDAGGLYQVGSFPAWGRWAEWNGQYRDDLRRFLKGNGDMVGRIVQRVQGSPDLYSDRGPTASVNFITCHDGFTLMDLFSYNRKHNDANGENNRDGADENYSWNFGHEGPTDDYSINRERIKQVKNAITILLLSRGVPMLLAGDEFGNTQFGNNNAYCQDNEISWLNWDLLEENREIFDYFKKMIEFRKKHPVLRAEQFSTAYNSSGYPEVSWHGQKAWNFNFGSSTLTMAVMFAGGAEDYGTEDDEFIYAAINMHWELHGFELPELPEGKKWYVVANTGMIPPQDMWDEGNHKKLEDQNEVLVGARSIILLTAK